RRNQRRVSQSASLHSATCYASAESPSQESSQPHWQVEEEFLYSSHDSLSPTPASKSRRLRTQQDDEDSQFQNEIETTYHPPKKPRRALPEVQTVNARSIEVDSDEEYGEQAGTSFNKQGHALGRAIGARRLGQGFNGRKGGNDVQQNNRSESTTSDPTAQTEI